MADMECVFTLDRGVVNPKALCESGTIFFRHAACTYRHGWREEASGKHDRVRSQHSAAGRREPESLQSVQGRKRTRIESEAAGMAPRQPPRQHTDLEWIESAS